jgi:hypothetical protein
MLNDPVMPVDSPLETRPQMHTLSDVNAASPDGTALDPSTESPLPTASNSNEPFYIHIKYHPRAEKADKIIRLGGHLTPDQLALSQALVDVQVIRSMVPT